LRIHLISVGKRMPEWIDRGYREYAKRMPRECALTLVEISPVQRVKGADSRRSLREEGQRMLKALPKDARVLAMDVHGETWTTEELAQRLAGWLAGGRDVCLLVGGPEGLDPSCLARAEHRWSLSALTFPHPLVRIMLAEQLYRAWSILQKHPYHRA
jgi:23S rRNA (pseudouridine1915-N3)-methyltransferase